MSQIHGSSVVSDQNPNKAPISKKSSVFVDLMSSTFFTVIGYVCLDVVFGISLHYIAAHNDPQAVAGLGLAFTTVNVLLIPMALGLNQSLNVHSAQALGAGKPKLAQTFFTHSIIMHLLYFIPFAGIAFNPKLVILLVIKDLIAMTINEADRQATSDASQTYLYYLLPSALFAILYECIKAYMIAHKIFAVFMFIQLITAGFHIFWCYLFIDVMNVGGGIAGAGLAVICTEFLNCFFCVLIIICSDYKHIVFENYSFKCSWKKQRKIFLSFVRNSLPIIAHIYADYFVFFLLNFIAVAFGSVQLNAQLALSNTSNFYYKFPISLSLALMTFIGNEMGAGNINRAKRYAWVGVIFFVCFTVVFLSCLTIFKEEWANFYSAGNPEITQLILDVYPIFVFGFFIIDGLQGTLTGILKGIERKEFVTYSTLLVYYLIGIPLVLYYACDLWGYGRDDKVYGIWFAFALVNIVLAILYLILTFTTNWEKMSEKIKKRVEQQHKMQNLFDSLNQEIFDEDGQQQSQKRKKYKQKRPQVSDQPPTIPEVPQRIESSSGNQSSILSLEHRQLVKDQQLLRGPDAEGLQYSLQETTQKKPKKKITADQLPVFA